MLLQTWAMEVRLLRLKINLLSTSQDQNNSLPHSWADNSRTRDLIQQKHQAEFTQTLIAELEA